ncbi:lactate racemase domain-containing protein [Edaphobacter flagellatus]|uniref:lactate racemase domain-containing protein n=1 Tax=Edaphobacter flagellatus TaxID=1933044 RepID=UPI0021B2BBA2|nr:lactate racemase domain-containing protein [Edaphobacter flagellatus]
MPWFTVEADAIPEAQIKEAAIRLVDEAQRRIAPNLNRVLLLPPDLTRAHSGVGKITEWVYQEILRRNPGAYVRVIPTLGQHVPHTEAENKWMFGSIPNEIILPHDWRNGVTHIGTIPAALVAETTAGAADWEIPVALNSTLIDQPWDLIVNLGHVVPHEVLGFANHNKNYFIGLGGKETICASHIAAAVYGIENNLGCLVTPLRACYNYAEEKLLGHLPDVYLQIVMQRDAQNRLVTSGLFIGDDLETYLAAARRSRSQNITVFDKPVKKIIAVMQADEFRATWVANKAVYRTRMAIADGGELLIIAPGVERFGEQPEVDALIRKYGYKGTPRTLALYKTEADMQAIPHGVAHLIHGSSEGRFTITYAPGPKISKEEIEQIGYQYASLAEVENRYNPALMKEGWNTMPDGEEVFYISTPSAGLWTTEAKLNNPARRDLSAGL